MKESENLDHVWQTHESMENLKHTNVAVHFIKVKKPFWKRLFSRKKYYWKLKNVEKLDSGTSFPAEMTFTRNGWKIISFTFKDGNIITYEEEL